MLTCDLCGEEMMLEEDMKTHVLLSHIELDLQCPLCSLSGVTYDELCFHISSAHPDNPPDPDPSCSTTDTSIIPPALDPGRSKQKQPPPPSDRPSSDCDSLRCEAESITSPFCVVGTRTFECPMCPVVCSDSAALQEHVELHLDCEAGGADADLALAQKLQQELEQQRLEDEAQRERQEFKRLQRQFGVDGGRGGGFRRQMERTMERAVSRGLMAPAEFHWRRAELMESLASGLDDGTTRTQGVMACLSHFFQSGCRGHVWLSADTDYFCSSPGDRGWGCGYRNFQMLLSSLSRIETYTAVLQGKDVPSVPQVQHMIEEAWRGGLDPQGASHFNQRLQGTRAWIGATEIYVLLTSLGISARIIDFHQPTGAAGTHPRLFDWVKQYFCQASGGSRPQTPLTQTSLPPLYLQHQGHSRCVVGLEQQKNGSLCLLLFDPGTCPSETRKLTSRDAISSSVRHIRCPLSSMKQQQYQLVSVEGVLSAEDKQIRILNSRTLRAERIS